MGQHNYATPEGDKELSNRLSTIGQPATLSPVEVERKAKAIIFAFLYEMRPEGLVSMDVAIPQWDRTRVEAEVNKQVKKILTKFISDNDFPYR